MKLSPCRSHDLMRTLSQSVLSGLGCPLACRGTTSKERRRTHAVAIASWMLAVKLDRSTMLEKAMLSSMTDVTTVTSPVSHCVTGSARQARSCRADESAQSRVRV